MPELETKKINDSLIASRNSLSADRHGGQASLEKLLKENLELNQKIYESCQKTEKYVHFVKAFNIFKFIVILIPVIIGVLFLLPIVGDFLEMYKGLFTSAGEMTGILEAVKDIQGL